MLRNLSRRLNIRPNVRNTRAKPIMVVLAGITLGSLTGAVCLLAVWAPPVRSQDQPEAAVEAVQPAASGDPKAATTTKTLDIPVDELRVLLKPLTLEELQNEVAGWMLLLQEKAKEISQAEVAIKRQNLAISKQEEAAKDLEKAQTDLKAAELAQSNANPGSPEAEAAAKKLEAAKDQLKKAQTASDEAKAAMQALQKDSSLRGALEQAKDTGDLEQAQQTLAELEKNREAMAAGSPTYADATEKIDQLEGAIQAFEKAKEAQAGAKPDSPAYKEATQQLNDAQATIRTLLKKAGVKTTDQLSKQSSADLNKATGTLNSTKIDSTQTEVSTSSSAASSDQLKSDQQQQQIENATQRLKDSVETQSDAKNQLVTTVTELQAQQTAIIDHLNVVLDELVKKGGSADASRQYIKAVSGVELDTKDAQGLGLRLLGWAKSDEGGLRWVSNTGKFLGIFLSTVLLSQLLGIILNRALSSFGGISGLMRNFIILSIKRGGIIVGFLLALTALEVSLGPILALLGGVSFVLAFALQNNLGNLASGLMIMAYKPFDIGDEVKVAGLWGWIDSITLANTKLKGFGGQMFTIPNNTVWSDTIENLSSDKIRKVNFNLRISYDEDLTRVQQVVIDILKSHPGILETPAPSVFFWSFEDYYLSIIVSGWAKAEEFWTVHEEIICAMHERFNRDGIKLAIPKQIEILETELTPSEKGKTADLMPHKFTQQENRTVFDTPPIDSAEAISAFGDISGPSGLPSGLPDGGW